MDLSLQLGQETSLKVSPTLIVLNQLLALSSLELQQLIQNELSENPALEIVEGHTCAFCGTPTVTSICPLCDRPTALQNTPPVDNSSAATDSASEDYYYNMSERPKANGQQDGSDEEFDPISLVASEPNRFEQILAELGTALPDSSMLIAAYLVGSLDERGYLSASLRDVARATGSDEETVEETLKVLQRVAPTGVGARDLRECLLLQLAEIKQRGEPELVPFVEEIIDKYLTELGEHKFTMIAHTLGTSYDSVVAVRDFIKRYMSPHPAYEPGSGRSWATPSPVRFVAPDVIIRLRNNEFEVEVVEALRFSLRVNPLYHRLSASASSHPLGKVQRQSLTEQKDGIETDESRSNGLNHLAYVEIDLTAGDKEHIRRYVNRSKLFISNVAQRRETMRRITNCLVRIQDEFLRHGIRHLKPLTRAQVAQYLGLHESTVSRATADKYVMLPNRQVIPFSDFFQASLSAKDIIRELITTEQEPLTDKEIVLRLRRQGVRIARRTVTKYRNQLGILPSTFR